MRRIIPLLLAITPLGFAPAPFLPRKPSATEADLKTIQGEWQLAGVPRLMEGDGRAVISGGSLTWCDGQREYQRWAFTLNPSAPRQIDVRIGRRRPYLGIYRLEGDTLTIAIYHAAYDRGGRPPGFGPSDELFVVTLKRKRPTPSAETPH
jgi:uncharacterized protein (TIGR03067 family)